MIQKLRSPNCRWCATVLLLLCLVVSACGPEPTPEPPTDVVLLSTPTPVPPTPRPPPATDTPLPPIDVPTPEPTPTMTADRYMEYGIMLHEQGNLEEGLATLDRAIALDPWLLEAYHYRHDLRLELETRRPLGELDREIAHYDQVIADDAKDARAYFERGVAKYQRTVLSGEPRNAEPVLDENSGWTVIGGVPTSYRLILEHAIADFDQAIELDPSLGDAYHMRGLAYHLQGLEYIGIALVDFDPDQFEHALRNYDQALALDSELAAAYHDRGTAYAQRGWLAGKGADKVPEDAMGDLEQATSDLTAAIEGEPQGEGTYLNRAFSLLILSAWLSDSGKDPTDRLQQWIDDSTKVIELNPGNKWGYFLRGYAYYTSAQESAEDESAAAVLEGRADEDFEVFDRLGAALTQRHELSDLVTRILTLSSGPSIDPDWASPSLLGIVEGDLYTSPDGGFRLQVPMLMRPNAAIWDELAGSDDLLVWFEDDLARWYALQVHPGSLEGQSLEEWVGESMAAKLDVQEVRQSDTPLGKAIVLIHRYGEPEADCCTALVHQDERFYSVSYCLLDHYAGEEEEANIRTFGDLYGIAYEPVDALALELLEHLDIVH